jgi:hypothetical protein
MAAPTPDRSGGGKCAHSNRATSSSASHSPPAARDSSSFNRCTTSEETAMKLTMISSIILVAGVSLCDAETVDRPPPTPIRSSTTEYPALRAFHHTVGETSYIGYYFNDRPSSCSVLIWSKPADQTLPEKTTHQQVRIDLNASQSITFFADHLGSNLSLECSADAKSLSVSETSVAFTQ